MRDAGVPQDEITRRLTESMQIQGDPITKGAAALAAQMKKDAKSNEEIQAALKDYFAKHGVALPNTDERE